MTFWDFADKHEGFVALMAVIGLCVVEALTTIYISARRR